MKKVRCDVYSRIVGYYSPVKRWNDGKKQEFAERQEYKVVPVDVLNSSPYTDTQKGVSHD